MRVNRTKIWPTLKIAKQTAIADIPILEFQAILVREAFTGNSHTETFTVHTVVTDGAWVGVIAFTLVIIEHAATRAVAVIVSTWIVIIAIYRISDALSFKAVISYGACISVDTFDTGKEFMLASFLAVTDIFRTGISIFAEWFTSHEVGFVNKTVAVVINSVADFYVSFDGIAFAKTGQGAYPLP